MTVTPSPDQLAWIEGDYLDVDDAVSRLVATGIAKWEEIEDDDMAWAKPLVDEALADIGRGNFAVIEHTDAYIDAIFRSTEG